MNNNKEAKETWLSKEKQKMKPGKKGESIHWREFIPALRSSHLPLWPHRLIFVIRDGFPHVPFNSSAWVLPLSLFLLFKDLTLEIFSSFSMSSFPSVKVLQVLLSWKKNLDFFHLPWKLLILKKISVKLLSIHRITNAFPSLRVNLLYWSFIPPLYKIPVCSIHQLFPH